MERVSKLDAPSKFKTSDITQHFSEPSKKQKEAYQRAINQQKALIEKLHDKGEPALAEKLEKCGEVFTMRCNGCSYSRPVRQGCKLKWCPVCVRKIAAERSIKYQAAVEAMEWPLFVTLTMPNTADLTGNPIRQMRQAFGKLRQHKLWKRNVRGGVAAIEITNIGNGWHPHLHTVIDCRWLAHKTPRPQKSDSKKMVREKCLAASDELGLAWARALQIKSFNPDWCGVVFKVKRCDAETIGREVLKYSVKGSDLVDCKEDVGELIELMKLTRLVTSFGSLFGKNRIKVVKQKRECECPECHGKTWTPECVLDGEFHRGRRKR